jgi:hypothetical protein
MKYKVSVNGFDKKVCKQAFLSLHCISNGRIIFFELSLERRDIFNYAPGNIHKTGRLLKTIVPYVNLCL